MDPQFLLKDEVEFELACRGYTKPGGLVSALKKILKKMIQAENLLQVSYEIKPPQSCIVTPTIELNICSDKISNILCYISELQEKPDKQLYKRLVSRLFHVVNRLKFITPIEEIDMEKKKALLDKAIILLKDLEDKDDIEDGDNITPEMKEALQNSLGEDSKKILKEIVDDAFTSDDVPSTSKAKDNMVTEDVLLHKHNLGNKRVSFAQDDLDIQAFHSPNHFHKLLNSTSVDEGYHARKLKLVPISQWGLQFSGDNRYSVNAFLERVDELKDARNATDEDLWRHAIDFFRGDALIWFRANRQNVTNWKELVLLLKRTFQSPYYQEELLSEAKSRTQGKNEGVLIFVSVMQNLFNRLPNKISETEQIMIIVKNLQPYYQRAVCRDVFTSIADLINILRIVERTKINCDNFQEPKTIISSLEPDLAYKPTSASKETEEILEIKNKLSDSSTYNRMRCWNCRETGHLFRSCSMPKQRLFCYKCGRFGVTSSSCICKGNATGERREPAK